jgi:hypothetical protein
MIVHNKEMIAQKRRPSNERKPGKNFINIFPAINEIVIRETSATSALGNFNFF